MRLAFIILVVIIPSVSYTSALSAYCKKTVKRPVELLVNGTKVTKLESRILTTCCDGYTRERRKCLPVCEKFCWNSVCTAPNVCSCKKGYERLNQFRCGPTCDNCKYGFCARPGVCSCYVGYTENRLTKRCEPSCRKPCVNGICSSPDFCKCNEGYRISPHDMFACIRNETKASTTTRLAETSSIVEELTTNNWRYKWYTWTTQAEEEPTSTADVETSRITSEEMPSSSTIRPITLPIEIPTSERMLMLMTISPRIQESTAQTDTSKMAKESSTSSESPYDIMSTLRWDSIEADQTYELTSEIEIDSISTEVGLTSTQISISTEIDPIEVQTETENYDQSETTYFLEPGTNTGPETHDYERDSSGFLELTESFGFSDTTSFVEDISERKDNPVVQSGILSSDTMQWKIMIGVLFFILSIIVMIATASLIWLKCSRFDGNEYNIDQLEKKEVAVKYSVEKNDLVTAW